MSSQCFLELLRAIAVATRPWLRSIFVPTIPARVRVLDTKKFEIFFPVRPFLRERRIAETGLDPLRHARFV